MHMPEEVAAATRLGAAPLALAPRSQPHRSRAGQEMLLSTCWHFHPSLVTEVFQFTPGSVLLHFYLQKTQK